MNYLNTVVPAQAAVVKERAPRTVDPRLRGDDGSEFISHFFTFCDSLTTAMESLQQNGEASCLVDRVRNPANRHNPNLH